MKNILFDHGSFPVAFKRETVTVMAVFLTILGGHLNALFAQDAKSDFSIATHNLTEATRDIIKIPSAVVKVADSVAVPAEHAGALVDVRIKEGQVVKAGDLIAQIRDSELKLLLNKATFEERIAELSGKNDVDIRFHQKSIEVAKADVQRSIQSNNRVGNSVPKAKVERQQLELDRTTLQLEQAQRDFEITNLKTALATNQVELAKVRLMKTQIRSPMTGMVVSLNRKRGEWIESSETFARIVRIDRLKVEGFVDAADAGNIKIGANAKVQFQQSWLKNKDFLGNVVFINPEANPVNSKISIWVEIENTNNQLIPGLRGEIYVDALSNGKSVNR